MPEDTRSLYRRHKAKGTRPSINEVSKSLSAALDTYSRVFIMIDALDECQLPDGGRGKLLSELFCLRDETGANLFATSRFIPEIMKLFEGSITFEIRANDADVQKYVESRFSLLPSFVLRSPTLQEDIKAGIISAVDGM